MGESATEDSGCPPRLPRVPLDQLTVAARDHGLAEPSFAHGDDRCAGGDRFQNRQAEGFELRGAHGRDRTRVARREIGVGESALELHADPGAIRLLDQQLGESWVLALVDDRELRPHAVREEPERFDDEIVTLGRIERAHRQHARPRR